MAPSGQEVLAEVMADNDLQHGVQVQQSGPRLYFKWSEDGLMLWTSWVDDCLAVGPKQQVLRHIQEFQKHFECDDQEEMAKYVGCKVKIDKGTHKMKLTQPVLIQSYSDKFTLKNRLCYTPAVAWSVLVPAEDGTGLSNEQQDQYQREVGKTMHMVWWTRPETHNAVRELTEFMKEPVQAYQDALEHVMRY